MYPMNRRLFILASQIKRMNFTHYNINYDWHCAVYNEDCKVQPLLLTFDLMKRLICFVIGAADADSGFLRKHPFVTIMTWHLTL